MAPPAPAEPHAASALCCAIAALLAVCVPAVGEDASHALAGSATETRAATVAIASLPRGVELRSLISGDAAVEVRPHVRLGVTPRVAWVLRAGFNLALDKLEQEPACGALFADLGAEAREALGGTLYYGSTPAQEAGRCRYAYAVTQVGSAVTRVCRNLSQASSSEAARVLIHEALHFAGLPERPQTAGAMSGREIDLMISARCRL